VKKHFDPAFKKKHQEEHDLQALHGCDDARGAEVRGGDWARGGAGRERGCERGRGRDKSVDRFESSERGDVMCSARDSTEHHAGDLKFPKLVPKSRAAIQKRAKFSDSNKGAPNIYREQLHELQQLRNEKKAHVCMLGNHAIVEEMGAGRGLDHKDDYEDEDDEEGFAAAAVKSYKCVGVKCATTRVCDASHYLTPTTPILPVSNPACQAIQAPASILRTNKTVFPQRALVVSDTYFQLSQASKAHKCALLWETSSRARLANVHSIEMYHGLKSVLESLGKPINGLCGAQLNDLLELHAVQQMSNSSVMSKIQNLGGALDSSAQRRATRRKSDRDNFIPVGCLIKAGCTVIH